MSDFAEEDLRAAQECMERLRRTIVRLTMHTTIRQDMDARLLDIEAGLLRFPSPWASPSADPNPMPRIRLWGRRAA